MSADMRQMAKRHNFGMPGVMAPIVLGPMPGWEEYSWDPETGIASFTYPAEGAEEPVVCNRKHHRCWLTPVQRERAEREERAQAGRQAR